LQEQPYAWKDAHLLGRTPEGGGGAGSLGPNAPAIKPIGNLPSWGKAEGGRHKTTTVGKINLACVEKKKKATRGNEMAAIQSRPPLPGGKGKWYRRTRGTCYLSKTHLTDKPQTCKYAPECSEYAAASVGDASSERDPGVLRTHVNI